MRIQKEQFSSSEALKFEKGLNVAITLGGAAGAYFGGSLALASLFMATPPGWIVAAVGIAICGIAALLGSGVSDLIMKRRKKEAKKAINQPLADMQKKLSGACVDSLKKVMENIQKALQQIIIDREMAEKNLEEALNTPVAPDEEKNLQDDIAYMKEAYDYV